MHAHLTTLLQFARVLREEELALSSYSFFNQFLTIGLSPSFQGLHVLEVMVIMGRMDRAIRIYTSLMGMKTEESRERRERPEQERMTAAKEATLAAYK